MLLPRFEYDEPKSLEDTCELMASFGAKAKLLAGGTDLLVNMKKKLMAPAHVVSLGRVEPLRALEGSNGVIRIGALMTASAIAEAEGVKKSLSALAKGASSLGSPLIRNLATIGGNLVSARPAADLPPPLMAYGAELLLKKKGGERKVPVEAFFKGPGMTVIGPDEILAEIVVSKPPPGSGAGYMKLGVRKTLEISIVNVAAFLSVDGAGAIRTARVVLGAVAPTPIRAPSAETVLVGQKPSQEVFAKAGEAAAGDSRPIDDFRGSAKYRREMVKVLTRRALQVAWDEARGVER
jgi:CO/xanthine dehydrogenase FAD-binding subunit